MNASGPLGDFIRSRRATIGPSDVGLPTGLGLRRTPGLRREELATLAGVSFDYYTRLEQGRERRPGRAVLDSLALALRLTADDRRHLNHLASSTASVRGCPSSGTRSATSSRTRSPATCSSTGRPPHRQASPNCGP